MEITLSQMRVFLLASVKSSHLNVISCSIKIIAGWNKPSSAPTAARKSPSQNQPRTSGTAAETSSSAPPAGRCTIRIFWRTMRKSTIATASATIAEGCSARIKSTLMG